MGFFFLCVCIFKTPKISLTTLPLASFEKTPPLPLPLPLPLPPPRTRWKDDDDDDDDGGQVHESTRFDDAFGSKRRSNPMRLFERDRKSFEHRDERERERS